MNKEERASQSQNQQGMNLYMHVTLGRATKSSYLVGASGFMPLLLGVAGWAVSFARVDMKTALGTGGEPEPAWRPSGCREQAGSLMLQAPSMSHHRLLGKRIACGCSGAQSGHVLGSWPCFVPSILHWLKKWPSKSNT